MTVVCRTRGASSFLMVHRFRSAFTSTVESFKLLGVLGAVLGLMLANTADPPAGDPPADPPASPPPPADPPADPPPAAKVEFTKEQQAEVDRIAADRAAKAADKARKDAETEAKTRADREQMDETERLKAEKVDAETKAAERISAADARVVKTEARAQAAAAGVKGDQLATFLRLVDLDGIDVDDDGSPDEKAIRTAIDKALKDDSIRAAFTVDAARKGGRSAGDMNSGAAKTKATSIEDAVSARLTGASN